MTAKIEGLRSANQTDRENAVRAALSAAGIESLEGLVTRLGKAPAMLESEDRILAVASLAGVSAPPRPHRAPTVGMVVDGIDREPGAIRDFEGRAMHSVPGVNSKGEDVLYSFTTVEGLQEYLTVPEPVRALDDLGTTNPDALPGVASFFEHADNQGDRLQNNPGRAWRNLTRVRRGFLNLADWNDIISAVDWCRWDISLYEHVDYGGSSLYLRAGRTYRHLRQFGWNDRASSTVNWGRRG